ncbi:MerR family transcriptional regulator [Allostreptomyces psammosilenae]|uniref:DNA-binding transcriptional MerR regulator n=1 Tax=Allostreptomyces psammosilenae TaxID=1892865 RepID=A0A853A071_9ACTN|nr:MerR family transcriptional regulator [Allostreptomyces psammosilenae]NYI07976.1 DNA-binding transcriptional MerR regulator [Allostreptomyces psammosilenae]
MSYSVGRVAAVTGVTVRTLHHYDEIGLLSPSGRTAAGYRRYSDADLERLQQILGYRELGFALEEIATILDEPSTGVLAHLRRQHALLTERIERLRRMVGALELTMEAHTMGIRLTPEERFEVFGDHDPDRYAAEAEERWGGTDAWAESRRRTASYTKEDWKRMLAEGEALNGRFAEAMRAGVPADDERAMDLAEEHRRYITGWHYRCSYEVHRGLGEMYLADERFTAYYEKTAPGLAGYVSAAILANADRAAAAGAGAR